MKKKMGIEGEGPKIILVTAVYLTIAYYLNKNFHSHFVIIDNTNLLNTLAIILAIIGLIFWLWSVVLLLMNFSKGKLIKTGPYAIFFHPIYDSFTFFLLPALTFYLNSDIFFNASAILFLGTIFWGRNEEKYLAEKFGKEYAEYRKRVWLKF
jgi:protein-S-isoprenylcysteine O-methyltransferase Ste14